MDERVYEHRDSHASSSHEQSLEPMRSVDMGKHSFKTHFPKDRNCDPKSQGPRAGDARVQSFPERKVLVIFKLWITKIFAQDVDLETIIDSL